MRIGLFSDTYLPNLNGVATSLYILKNNLEKLGHEVFVVTVNDQKFSYRYDEETKVFRMPSLPMNMYDYRFSGPYHQKAVKRIKEWQLDIIHCQQEAGIGIFARIIGKMIKVPVVHTYHTDYEEFMHYATKGKLDAVTGYVIKPLARLYCDKTVTELIVPSQKTYTLFKEKYRFDRNIHIVPNGIEIERFYEENVDMEEVELLKKKFGLTKKDFVYLYLGRLGQEKNIELLIEASKIVIPKNPNFKFVIVGGLDGPAAPKLQQMVKDYNLDNNVIFTGKSAFEDTPLYYHMADAFVMASLFDTQGVTVIEAMASSVIPVCINDPSFTATVVNGLNGFIFDTKEECADILEQISKNKKKLSQMKKQAKLTSQNYDAITYAKRVYAVYEEALDNHIYKESFIKRTINKLRGKS